MTSKPLLLQGDCRNVLDWLPSDSVDAVVTDPPYGLSFMGKGWDYDVPGVEVWREVFRILKPGGHLLSFFGTRTYHRGVIPIENAGFEIRDQIGWAYGSGFPKSHNVGKGIDAKLLVGSARTEDIRRLDMGEDYEPSGRGRKNYDNGSGSQMNGGAEVRLARTPEAQRWQGWGTALKPAWEPIVLARKPLIGTVADNVLAHGTGALNIDGCRIEGVKGVPVSPNTQDSKIYGKGSSLTRGDSAGFDPHAGRWPANLIHDGSAEACAPLGEASRFYYCAKASKKDRDEGLDEQPDAVLARSTQAQAEAKRGNTIEEGAGAFNKARIVKNNHPTVKPTELMRYLCRLITPPGGTVLDPFMGSGSTGKAATLEGFQFIGIEREPEYLRIAEARIEHARVKALPPVPTYDFG